MTSTQLLIAVIVALLVLAFVAYLVRGRLSKFTLSWGNKKAELAANTAAPGIKASHIYSGKDTLIKDQSGKGVDADYVTSSTGKTTILNETPPKNG
jgi:hypothetical protein